MAHRIYVSRPIDGRDSSEIYDIITRAKKDFRSPKFEVIDPTAIPHGGERQNHNTMVPAQLNLMKDCDIILADMSLPNHTYIGCIAELVYARLYELCSVVFVGSNRISHRPWLRYHSDHIDTSWEGAVQWIHGRFQ
jgi:hypothetical protein